MDGQPERSRYISGTAVMDSATPSSLFADLTRHSTGIIPSCTSTDSSLHSRYIQASLPLGSASTCPYLGGMYAGSLPAPPNSPFRSPTGNIRQFWPPTPPPEGYNRYGVSPAIYPLFPSVASIAPSSENGTLLTPGLGSRLGTLPTHFPHLLDSYSDPTYYSSGYGLGSSLPPSSHVTPNLSLSNLTPTLERHPSYVPLVGRVKGLSIPRQQQPEDEEVHRGKGSNFMKWDIPYASENTKSTKAESQPKSKDSISKDDIRSASSKGKGENRASTKKNETKHQVKQVVPSGGDGNKSTSVINGSLSSVPSENYDIKLANSRSVPECPKCIVTPSSVVRPVNCVEAEGRGDSDAVISLVHVPSVTTVTKTVAPSLPNCTVANSHVNQSDDETVNSSTQHPTIASQQPPTAITYVSRQLCYQSISESTVSKSLTGTSSCLSVKISGHVTSVSSSQVVLDGNKNLSEKVSANTESEAVSPIWSEQKPVENVSTKDFQKTEESQSDKTDKMPSVTLPSITLPSPTENASPPVRDNLLLQMKDHSQNALKVPSSVGNITPTHQTSNRLSTVYCKNIRNTKLGEQMKVTDTKETSYVPLSIQPKKEQSSSCKIEQVKPSLPNNWNRTRSHENACDAECEPQAINLSLTQKLPKSEPSELPNCKTVNIAKAPPLETTYLPVKSLTCGELSSNTRTKSQLPDTCLKTKKISAIRWPQTQNLSNRFGSNTTCHSRTTTHSLGSVSVRSVKSCLSQQPVVPSSTPVTNVSSLVKPTLSVSTKSSLKSAAAIKLPGRGASDSNCHRNSISVAPSLSTSIENTRKATSDDGQSAPNLLPTLSLPFSGTVNSSIPIGIAIAQQRQETTTSPKPDEKREITEQPNHVTSAPVTNTTNLVEVVRDQKSTDRIPRHSAPADAGGVLVTLGPTTLSSNQWDSDATTRTSMSQPWMTHTPVVAPTVWVGQSVQSTPAASTTLPVMPVSTLDTSQVPISTGGFQLARDPLTGHLYLIPATKLTDHTGMWPVFVPTNGSVPLQQVVPHTQNNQVIETDQVTDSTVTLQQSQTQIQSIRLHTTAPTEKTFCDINATVSQENQDNSQFIYPSVKQETKEEKSTDISLLNSLPVATGQPFAYAAFSLHGGTVSYYFEPTSVVHLAQTQVTASIQTESGKRSQGTSPLHCVTPSPPPSNPTEQGTQASGTDEPIDEGDESDDSSSANQASTQTRISSNTMAVATATQVDMNSDDDYEERNVEMSDSACQTEAIIGNMLREDDVDDDTSRHSQLDTETNLEIEDDAEAIQPSEEKPLNVPLPAESDNHRSEIITKKEFCEIDVEIASDSTPVLTAESKPVMDFIDHHGLDLLVDSIEEFACREQEMQQEECKDSEPNENTKNDDKDSLNAVEEPKINEEKKKSCVSTQNQNSSTYPSIDPFCVDGLGLLCALAEQRFLEEKMNSHDDKEGGCSNKTKHTCSPFTKDDRKNVDISNSSVTESKPKAEIFAVSSFGKNLLSKDHKHEASLILSPGENMDPAELEMRIRMAELQHKYKQKQQELSRLRPKTKKEIDSIPLKKPIAKLKGQQIFTYCKSRSGNKPNVASLSENKPTVPVEKAMSELEGNGQQNNSPTNKCLKMEKTDDNLNSSYTKTVQSLSDKNITTYSNSCKENNQLLHQNSQPKPLTSDVLKGDDVFLSEKVIDDSVPTKNCMEDPHIQSIKVEKTDDDITDCKDDENDSSAVNSGLLIPKVSEENTSKSLDIGTVPVPSNNEKQHTIKDETEKKVPFFDESVWSIRRSERIFLHEAGVVKPSYDSSSASNKKKRTISLPQGKINEKMSLPCPSTSSKSDSGIKQKISQKLSESSVLKTKKKIPIKKTTDIKARKTSKIQNKKNSTELLHCTIPSVLKKNDTEESSSSDSDSSTSDESDSSSSDTTSSDDSDDTPLSALIRRPTITPADAVAKAQSCIMTVESLQDKQRVLMMDDGLFYGGHVISIHAPDVYGIHLDGDRGSRHRIYSREEMLKETVLEVKPTSHLHLIEGSRVCAFWSQQYRCLYPGTVTKSNSSPDDGLIYVEFDDGDSGRIPLEDICLLPPNYPIVTVKPTPHLALKRRHCISSKQNSDAKKKIICPLKDTSQPSNKSHKTSSKKVKTNHTDKRSCSPFHTTKAVTSASDQSSSISGSNVLPAPQAASLSSMINSRKDTKIVKQNAKITPISGSREKTENVKTNSDGQLISKLKKHKRHHDESKHHHHHHHRHHHHHHRHHHRHKRHKHDKQKAPLSSEQCKLSPTHASPTSGSPLRSSSESSVSSDSSSMSSVNANFSLSNKSNNSPHNHKKSELTVKIKTNPTDTHLHADEVCNASSRSSSDSSDSSDTSSDEDNSVTAQEEMRHKVSTSPSDNGEKKGRDRRPSVEKSKIAAFLPARQLWRWSGNCFRRRATKGRAKKDYYRAVTRGKETIKVGDCAVFLSTGRPHLPYIGRIETMWQSWGGNMVVKVKWFYHPEETRGGKRLAGLKGALFQSSHLDENDVQTISHKCEVLSWDEYKRRRDQEIFQNPAFGSIFDNNDIYYLAGTYEPTTGIITMEPGIT